MKMHKRPAFLLILLAAAAALPAFAYEYPLSSYAIREAFLFGTALDGGAEAPINF